MAASKRPLIWLAIACLAPFAGSYALWKWWTPPGGQVNYGTLIAPKALPVDGFRPVAAQQPNAIPVKGKWLLVVADAPQCEATCQARLYATRQVRTMTGKDRDRVTRIWLLTADGAPDPALLAQHPDVVLARADPALAAALPDDAGRAIYIVDPLGNAILRYPPQPDIGRLYKDLARLLVASQIG